MKTKCSLLIYNKAIGYVSSKCYTYLCVVYNVNSYQTMQF